MFGPWLALPPPLQQKALSLVAYFKTLPTVLLRALTACSFSVPQLDTAKLILEVLHSHVPARLSLDTFLSLAVTLVQRDLELLGYALQLAQNCESLPVSPCFFCFSPVFFSQWI